MQKWHFLKYFYFFHAIFSGSSVIEKQVVNNTYHQLMQIFLPPFSLAKKPPHDLQITAYYYTLYSLSVFSLARSLEWIFVLYFILSKKKISRKRGHMDYSLKEGHEKQCLVWEQTFPPIENALIIWITIYPSTKFSCIMTYYRWIMRTRLEKDLHRFGCGFRRRLRK